MNRTLGTVLAVGCLGWILVSAVVTLWSRLAEAAAFGSFCLLAGAVAVVTWRYLDPTT